MIDTLWENPHKRRAMKRLLALPVILLAFIGLPQIVSAGPERIESKDKMVQPVVEPSCDWYRANEWDVSIFFAAGFPSDKSHGDLLEIATNHENIEGRDNHEDNIASYSADRFLNQEHAFGGGADLKYFINKNFGLGVEAFALGAHNIAGEVLGTITIRWPLGCSRFAPYVFFGGGAAFGGSRQVVAEEENPNLSTSAATSINAVVAAPGTVIVDSDTFFTRRIDGNTRAAGQIGGGMEYRFTHHIGLTGDFSWNFVGSDSSFGLVRTGLTFGF